MKASCDLAPLLRLQRLRAEVLSTTRTTWLHPEFMLRPEARLLRATLVAVLRACGPAPAASLAAGSGDVGLGDALDALDAENAEEDGIAAEDPVACADDTG